jgi:hypothetical protein
VKRTAKPVPVKRRPPTTRRFYFTELAVPLMCKFVSYHVLANSANAALVPGYRRDPPRHFAFSSSTAPTTPLPRFGIASFPGMPQVHLDLHRYRIIGLHLLGRPPSAVKMTPAISCGSWNKLCNTNMLLNQQSWGWKFWLGRPSTLCKSLVSRKPSQRKNSITPSSP